MLGLARPTVAHWPDARFRHPMTAAQESGGDRGQGKAVERLWALTALLFERPRYGKTTMEMHIGVGIAVRMIAKRAVESELRSQGVRVTLVPPAEINQRATAYIATHPEIWVQALERAKKIEEAEEARKARRRQRRGTLR